MELLEKSKMFRAQPLSRKWATLEEFSDSLTQCSRPRGEEALWLRQHFDKFSLARCEWESRAVWGCVMLSTTPRALAGRDTVMEKRREDPDENSSFLFPLQTFQCQPSLPCHAFFESLRACLGSLSINEITAPRKPLHCALCSLFPSSVQEVPESLHREGHDSWKDPRSLSLKALALSNMACSNFLEVVVMSWSSKRVTERGLQLRSLYNKFLGPSSLQAAQLMRKR